MEEEHGTHHTTYIVRTVGGGWFPTPSSSSSSSVVVVINSVEEYSNMHHQKFVQSRCYAPPTATVYIAETHRSDIAQTQGAIEIMYTALRWWWDVVSSSNVNDIYT